MVDAAEFNVAWQKIQRREAFELDIDDNTLLIGWNPEGTEADKSEIFDRILRSSLAYVFLDAAWRFGELWYIVAINGIVVGFRSPFGWSFLTDNSYIAGNMPKDWRRLHDLGKEQLLDLLCETTDADYPNPED